MAAQLPSSVWNNQNLFSHNYLEARLPESELWGEISLRAGQALEAVRRVFVELSDFRPGPGEEALLEERLIRPVFRALDLEFDIQPRTRAIGRVRRPDYALFPSRESLAEARRDPHDLPRYFAHVVAIADAKYWGRPLDQRDPNDAEARDPTAKLVRDLDDAHYLSGNRVNWAILTNGKHWRLFSYRTPSRSTNYYEVDLEAAVLSGNIRNFMYFFLFFARGALAPDPTTGKCWLDLHIRGSEEYSRAISEQLKERVFDRVFERLAEGFIDHRQRALGVAETEETLREVFGGCLLLLYRLLFLLYAESRRLLPVDDAGRYYNQSLTKLKRDIHERIRHVGLEGIDVTTSEYWARLNDLCRIVHDGSQALQVPRYNGNLFRTEPGGFLVEHRMGDRYIAAAINELTVDDSNARDGQGQPYFDYSSLGVRHLGDIYEGLLEFRIRIAQEPVVEVLDQGRRIWRPATGVPESRVRDRRHPGQVYVETSRHERRLTGSYFTPHVVVAHMVQETLVPVVEERLNHARELTVRWVEEPTETRGDLAQGAFEAAFSVRVLDPAMGSGHFLVDAVDALTNHLIHFLGEFRDNPISERIATMRQAILDDLANQGIQLRPQDLTKLTEPNLVKRMVMKRCVFGVDVNQMAVELAKLSLWLDSFTIGAPLSFLDHHLRCGNSLIGASLQEVEQGISEERRPGAAGAQRLLFGGRYAGVLDAAQRMLDVAALTDVTWEERMTSEDIFRDAERALVPFRRALNLWTAEEFGGEGGRGFLSHGGDDVDARLASPERLEAEDRLVLDRADKVALDHGFLHWELAFPEIFYDRSARRNNPGFDVVIGNPPYVRIQEMDDELERQWLRSTVKGEPRYRTAFRNFDLYVPFIERGFSLCGGSGRFCFIVPNKWLQAEYGERLRRWLAEREAVTRIVNFGDNQIFGESRVTNYTCLLYLSAVTHPELHYLEVLPLGNVGNELATVLGDLESSALVAREAFYQSELGADPWCFPVGMARTVRQKAENLSGNLSSIVAGIIVGVQTSADKVYILRFIGPGRSPAHSLVFSGSLGQQLEMETALLKPLISGKGTERYGAFHPVNRLLFPYRMTADEKAELIPEPVFSVDYPRAWDYLRRNEEVLRLREGREMDHDRWYAYVYPKNLDKQESQKICVPRLVDRLKAFYDSSGALYLDNVDVNGILLDPAGPVAPRYVLALLNSRLMNFVFKQCSVRFQNMFFSANKQFISPLPMRRIAFVTPTLVRAEEVRRAQEYSRQAIHQRNPGLLLQWVTETLQPSHDPDHSLAALHSADAAWDQLLIRTEGGWERSDVVHDMLAELAGTMERLWAEAHAERRDFLGWLSRALQADLTTFRGRDRLAKYEHLDSNELFGTLGGPRRGGPVTFPRDLVNQVTSEFERSKHRLHGILAEAEAVDSLIDAMIYRLYRLTEQEIRLVEGEYGYV
jgi:hypothetical protein